MDISHSEPFEVLQHIAELSTRHARGLPERVDVQPEWSGVGFQLRGMRYVAPMREVAEMLVLPEYTRIPGVKPWVKGVANVRGRLLPMLDLEVFFGSQLDSARKQHRVLALEIGDFYCGVIVNNVYGMQHFPLEAYSEQAGEDDSMTPYVKGLYEHGGRKWTVFSLFELARDPQFFNAALH